MSLRKHSEYLNVLFEKDAVIKTFENTVPTEIQHSSNLVVYVGTGISGVAAVAMLYQGNLIDRYGFVRKRGDTLHATHQFESNLCYDTDLRKVKWVFIDDFISTGQTLRRCADMFMPENCLGALLYHGSRWISPEGLRNSMYNLENAHPEFKT